MKQEDLDRITKAIERTERERNRAAWISILSKPDMMRYSEKYERRAIGLDQILKRLWRKHHRLTGHLYVRKARPSQQEQEEGGADNQTTL